MEVFIVGVTAQSLEVGLIDSEFGSEMLSARDLIVHYF
jgi:hypothetical protein